MKVDKKEYSYFLKNILEAIETSSGIYGNNATKVAALSSLELMWDKLNLDDYFYNYDITEQDFCDYIEKRATEANVREYLHSFIFDEENEDEETK